MSIQPELIHIIMIFSFASAAFIYFMNKIGWGWLSFCFTVFILLCIGIGNTLSELPTARMFANDKQGEIAFTLLIIGISGSMVLFGSHASTPLLRRVRDFVFCFYSVVASTLGIYAITSDAEQQNSNRKEQIFSLEQDIKSLRYGANGLSPKDGSTPCARTTWCNSAEKQSLIDEKQSKLNNLQDSEVITAFDALSYPAELLDVDVEILAFIFNASRSLVAMYALLIVSGITRRQFYTLTDPDALRRIEKQTDNRRQTARQTKTSLFKRNNKQGREDLFGVVKKWHYKNNISPTVRSVNKALASSKLKTIDNNAASAMAKKLRSNLTL